MAEKKPYVSDEEMKRLSDMHNDVKDFHETNRKFHSLVKLLLIFVVPIFILCLGYIFWIATTGKITNLIEARGIIAKYNLLEKSVEYRDTEKIIMMCMAGMEKRLRVWGEMYSSDRRLTQSEIEQIASLIYMYKKTENRGDNFDKFILALIASESQFDKKAVSAMNARGIMQLMPDTFKWMNLNRRWMFEYIDIENVYHNVECGILYTLFCEKYLKSKLERTPSLKEISYAYNMGHHAAPDAIKASYKTKRTNDYMAQETIKYGDKLMYYYTNYCKEKYDVYWYELFYTNQTVKPKEKKEDIEKIDSEKIGRIYTNATN